MQPVRPIGPVEVELITALSRFATSPVDLSDLESSEVIQMDDGGMGSFAINPDLPSSVPLIDVAAADGLDEDGIQLCLTLFVDDSGKPREVDVWKVNFHPVVRLPAPANLTPVPRPLTD